jgi:hypothetical protein
MLAEGEARKDVTLEVEKVRETRVELGVVEPRLIEDDRVKK